MAYKDMTIAEILRRLRRVEDVGLFPQLDHAISLASPSVLERAAVNELGEFEAMRARCSEAMKYVAIHGYSSLEKQNHPFIQLINEIRDQVRTSARD